MLFSYALQLGDDAAGHRRAHPEVINNTVLVGSAVMLLVFVPLTVSRFRQASSR